MWTNSVDGGGELFPNEEFDRLEAAKEVLTNHYPHAKTAILSLEMMAKKRSERAVYELRDTLDHISIALSPETTPCEARRHFAECHTHLRRSAVEPYEWMAEKTFLEIEKIAIKGKLLYRLLLLKPPEGHQVIDDLRIIAERITEGRVTKGTAASVLLMKEACKLATESLKKWKPKEYHDRVYHLCLAGVFFFLLLGNTSDLSDRVTFQAFFSLRKPFFFAEALASRSNLFA